MSYLHEKGICHGDLYAHNVLVDGETGATILCDFGASFFYPSERHEHHHSFVLEGTEVRAFGLMARDMACRSMGCEWILQVRNWVKLRRGVPRPTDGPTYRHHTIPYRMAPYIPYHTRTSLCHATPRRTAYRKMHRSCSRLANWLTRGRVDLLTGWLTILPTDQSNGRRINLL